MAQIDLLSMTARMDLQTAAFKKGAEDVNKKLDDMSKKFAGVGLIAKKFAVDMALSFGKEMISSIARLASETAKLYSEMDKTSAAFISMEQNADILGLSLTDVEDKSIRGLNDALGDLDAVMIAVANKITAEIAPAIIEAINWIGTNLNKMARSIEAVYHAMRAMASLKSGNFSAFTESYGKMIVSLSKVGEKTKIAGIQSQDAAEKVSALREGYDKLHLSLNKGDRDWANYTKRYDKVQSLFEEGVISDKERIKTQKDLEKAYLATFKAEGKTGKTGKTRKTGRISSGSREAEALAKANQKVADSYQRLLGSTDPIIKAQQDYIRDMKIVTDEITRVGGATEEHVALMAKLKDSFAESGDSASAWSDITSSAISDFASGMADTLVDGILSGKMAFEDFIKSFLAGIAKAIIQAQILAAIEGVRGKFNIGGGGGTATPAMAAPGITPLGGISAPVAPSLFSSCATRSLPASRASSGVNVTVNNYSKSEVETTQQRDDSGNVNIQVMVTDMIKSAMGNGSMDSTMAANYGARRQPA